MHVHPTAVFISSFSFSVFTPLSLLFLSRSRPWPVSHLAETPLRSFTLTLDKSAAVFSRRYSRPAGSSRACFCTRWKRNRCDCTIFAVGRTIVRDRSAREWNREKAQRVLTADCQYRIAISRSATINRQSTAARRFSSTLR